MRYLGTYTEKIQKYNGHEIWKTASRSYITNDIETVEGLFLEDDNCEVLKSNVRNPFPSNYRPELDIIEELGTELLSYYLQLVGIFRWVVDIGRIRIFHDTSLMLQYQANTCIGYIEVIYHIFAYLKIHMNMGNIGYDLMGPNVDLSVFNDNADWAEFYGEVEE